MVNFYDLFNLSPEMPVAEMLPRLQAYRNWWVFRTNIPDRQRCRHAERMAALVEEAGVLLDDDRRAEYDRELARHSAPPSSSAPALATTVEDSAPHLLESAWGLMHKARFAEAADVADRAVRLSRANAAALAVRGYAHWQQRRLDKAARDHKAALERDPANPLLHHDLGWILWEQGESDRALETVRQAAQLAPDTPFYTASLGVLFRLRGDLDKAIQLLEEAHSHAPSLRSIENELALAYNQKGLSRFYYNPDDGLRYCLSKRSANEACCWFKKALRFEDKLFPDLHQEIYLHLDIAERMKNRKFVGHRGLLLGGILVSFLALIIWPISGIVLGLATGVYALRTTVPYWKLNRQMFPNAREPWQEE